MLDFTECTGILRQFVPHIITSVYHPNPRVRTEAMCMLKLMVHHGHTQPHTCIPTLIAALADR